MGQSPLSRNLGVPDKEGTGKPNQVPLWCPCSIPVGAGKAPGLDTRVQRWVGKTLLLPANPGCKGGSRAAPALSPCQGAARRIGETPAPRTLGTT